MPATSQRIAVGKTTFRSTYADANALWRVIGKKGKDCYLCQIQNEPVEIDGTVYSGDYAGIQKVFMRSEIHRSLQWKNFFDKARDDSNKFYDSLQIGQTVHYHDGFGAYIRCEVVGGQKLKPVALVGNWREYDLPTRRSTGEIIETYWSEKLKQGELFEPNASNIWEFYQNDETNPAHIPVNMRNGNDPTTMDAINLDLPETTAEEKRVADLWRTVEGLRELVGHTTLSDPQQIIDGVVQYLKSRNL
jgi:hypothetical protein